MFALAEKLKKDIFILLRIFLIQYQAIKEIYEFLRITFSKHNDLDYIEMEMRHLAHMLEKTLQIPEKKKQNRLKRTKNYQSISNLIRKWDTEIGSSSQQIEWVKKIFREYTVHNEMGWYCDSIGKIERKLRGLKEIQKANVTNSQIAEIDLLEFMKGRRSVRNWTDNPVNEGQIKLLVEAASWAPSSCNRQTTRFIAIQDKQKMNAIAKTIKGGRNFFHRVPLLLVIVSDVRRYQFPEEKHIPYQDSAAAIQNLLLMAHRMGLSACWGSYTSDTFLILGERKVRKLLNIPRYYKITGIVAIGKPNMKVCMIPRTEVGRIMYMDKMNG